MDTSEASLVRRFSVKRVEQSGTERVMDTVAAEEPLEIRVRHWVKEAPASESLAVTMRTPGHDRELAVGFLVSEGIARNRRDIVDLRALGTEPSNEIVVELAKDVDFESWRAARSTLISSSCGICGKRNQAAVAQEIPPRAADRLHVTRSLIERLPALVARAQRGFAQTGGLHAAALICAEGELVRVFEDIGRHNALDKLIGWVLLEDRLPLQDEILFLSSRSSFELLQKCAMSGARVLATVGGPSSLAIEAAREFGITLIGFVRDGRFNIYSGEWRIDL